MFYNLFFPLADHFSLFNLFQYITVRAGGALATAFVLSLVFGPWLIQTFRVMQGGSQTVKEILPHQSKAGTPSMGGVLVVGTFTAATLLWSDLTQPYTWVLLGTVLTFCGVGLVDDYCSLAKKWKNGVPGTVRLGIQTIVALAAVYMICLLNVKGDATLLYFPFFKDLVIDLGLPLFLIFGTFVVVGTANAVNLTDGLDGLVSIPAAIVAAAFAMLAYIVGRADFTQYLNIAHIPGAGDITIMCSALVGSILGFLWFNAPPARIFMGDTGALAIGGFLGAVAIMIKQEFTLVIIGGLFVMETASVILQVVGFKLTGKRIFRMAPLHHHFEQKGWPESTIVVRFWIIALILAMVGLATLKLR